MWSRGLTKSCFCAIISSRKVLILAEIGQGGHGMPDISEREWDEYFDDRSSAGLRSSPHQTSPQGQPPPALGRTQRSADGVAHAPLPRPASEAGKPRARHGVRRGVRQRVAVLFPARPGHLISAGFLFFILWYTHPS